MFFCLFQVSKGASFTNRIQWARDCINRDSTKDPHAAAKLQQKVERMELQVDLQAALQDPLTTYNSIKPTLEKCKDAGIVLSPEVSKQVWALFLVESLTAIINTATNVVSADQCYAVFREALCPGGSDCHVDVAEMHTTIKIKRSFDLLKPNLNDLQISFHEKLVMVGSVLISDVFKKMFALGEI